MNTKQEIDIMATALLPLSVQQWCAADLWFLASSFSLPFFCFCKYVPVYYTSVIRHGTVESSRVIWAASDCLTGHHSQIVQVSWFYAITENLLKEQCNTFSAAKFQAHPFLVARRDWYKNNGQDQRRNEKVVSLLKCKIQANKAHTTVKYHLNKHPLNELFSCTSFFKSPTEQPLNAMRTPFSLTKFRAVRFSVLRTYSIAPSYVSINESTEPSGWKEFLESRCTDSPF